MNILNRNNCNLRLAKSLSLCLFIVLLSFSSLSASAFTLIPIPKPHAPQAFEVTPEDISNKTNPDKVMPTETSTQKKETALEDIFVGPTLPACIEVENGRISVQAVNANVLDLLNSVFEKLDKKIIINSNVRGRVSIKLNDVTPNELLDLLSVSLGFNWTEKGGVFLVSTEEQLVSPNFFPVQYADLNDMKNALATLGLGNKLIVNSYPRGILVNASPEKAREISDIVERLDRSAPSVKVEFKVVEVNKDEEKKIGIAWQDVSGNYQFNRQLSSGAVASTTITRTLSTGLLASTQEYNNIGKVLAKPYIITLNNLEAHLATGDEVPIFSKDINGNPSVEYKKVGIELYATPSIVNAADGMLNIKAKTIVNIISGKETQQNLTAPQISTREAQTTMNVRSGETIIIGGLLKEEDIRSETGVPLLDRLPLIGNLFKLSNKSKTTTEILIFITPTLINSTNPI